MPNITVTPPPDIVQSERPVVVSVQSEVLGANTFPEVTFIFADSNLGLNQSITFLDYTFFGTGPDPETGPFDFESELNGRKQFVRAFQGIPVLSRDWQIWESISGKIHIRRRFPGEIPGLTVTEQNLTGFVLYPAESSDGAAATFGDQSEDYRVIIRVYEDDLADADFPYADYQREFRGELLLNYQPDNQYEFDLSPFLGQDFVDYLPALTAGFQFVTGSVRHFNYQVYEGYLNSAGFPIRMKENESAHFKLIFGKKAFVDIDDYTQTLPSKPLMSDLTERLVRQDENQFMIFYYDTDTGTLELEVTLNFLNGTQSTETIYSQAVTNYGVWYVNTGFDSLGLSSFESEFLKIGSYQVRAKLQGGAYITTSIKYVPREECGEIHTVAFQNDFGMYELFTFSGNMEKTARYQSETFRIPAPVAEDAGAIQRQVLTNDSVFTRKLYSHGLKANNFDSLRELVTSEQVYLVEGGQYIPVIVTDVSYGPRDDKNSLYFVSITVEPSQQSVVI